MSAVSLASLASLAVLLTAGCMGVNIGDSGSSSSGSGSSGATAAASADAGAEQGQGCITEPTTGATLCTAVSTCPSLAIDHDAYPDCGFRVRFGGLDLECACSGYLCPIGAPSTCSDATQLLTSQTEAAVCAQVSEGRCTSPASSSGAAGSTGASSSCDKTCESECAGAATCIKACGC